MRDGDEGQTDLREKNDGGGGADGERDGNVDGPSCAGDRDRAGVGSGGESAGGRGDG